MLIFILTMLLLYLLLILQRVAYYTLLERHVLGLTQNRFGPKKTGFYGLLQPIIDGLKLVKKEQILIFNCSPSVFLGITVGNFALFYVEFLTLPYPFRFITMNWRYLLLLVLVGVNVYFLILGGVFSKSKYSYLGGIRRRVARVSYEVVFTLTLIYFILYDKSYVVVTLRGVGTLTMFLPFLISTLVELRRAPFDYSESESELVRGFNTEYSRVGFVLLFLKEYGRLIFFRILIADIFTGGVFRFTVVTFVGFVLLRSSLPRFRYDKLMGVMWLEVFFLVAQVTLYTYFLINF